MYTILASVVFIYIIFLIWAFFDAKNAIIIDDELS